MPELPEVETIRRQLQKHIVGKTIKAADVLYSKVIHGIKVEEFLRTLQGRKIREIGRQGKLVLIRLSGEETLVIHLKMTGRLLLGGPPTKFTEVILTFSDGTILRYDDLRRFGYMKVLRTSDESRLVHKEQMGIDFFDRTLTLGKFKELLRSRRGSQIKPLLLDQSLIAGVGNIYAQEACFAAKIDPLRKVSEIPESEIGTLFRALHNIMNSAIKYGGTSSNDYRDTYGKEGKFAGHLKVYGREGKLCFRCKTKLVKMNIGGRGTVFCTKCQNH